MGLASGTPVGEAGGVLGAASLANKNGLLGGGTNATGAATVSNPTAGSVLGGLSGALSVYTGLEKGGISGDGQAVVGGLQTASAVASLAGDAGLASSLSSAAGYVAAPLAIYNAINNWQKGNVGMNALDTAEAGAAIGSFVGPIGTVVGAAVGAVVGAVTSLIQGPHSQDEITNANEPDSTTIQLQSGNSALLASDTANPTSGVAYGAGTSRAGGSSQWFLDPAASGTLNKDTGSNAGSLSQTAEAGQANVTAGTPFYIGTAASNDLTSFANSVPVTNGTPDFSSVLSQYAANPDSDSGIIGVYNNNGGQDAWGMPFSSWVSSVWNAKNGVTGNLNT
jgi:gas vesicle protein